MFSQKSSMSIDQVGVGFNGIKVVHYYLKERGSNPNTDILKKSKLKKISFGLNRQLKFFENMPFRTDNKL